jgi:hypothetical protein
MFMIFVVVCIDFLFVGLFVFFCNSKKKHFNYISVVFSHFNDSYYLIVSVYVCELAGDGGWGRGRDAVWWKGAYCI